MKNRYICIHGHFYQPPRENPWLETIERQQSAYPYHDWNERVAAECYAPNGAARILDSDGRIARIVNNYAHMSFDFGPTLLAWMEAFAPGVYAQIIEADSESRELFGGHGSALAQAYNHVIMPLACRRDKETQIYWGLRDFEYRFGRPPEGMWLPETAVDLETLDIMAEHDISFTILAPHQAHRIRKTDSTKWIGVEGGKIDPTRAYFVELPSGRRMSVFFYDGPISHAVAFEQLLASGETFARRLEDGFSEDRNWPQLVHIATDGETFGHHHRHGEMALAYALGYIVDNGLAQLTNYGEYLEFHPPDHEVEIIENTSWSCIHGVERWRKGCGCNSGGHSDWKQDWRAPLRDNLEWLRDEAARLYEESMADLLKDPWEARHRYIDSILDRSTGNLRLFLDRHAHRQLDDYDTTRVLEALELQRHSMLMFTSCGWFFDELSGIETVQVIEYAGRVVQLAAESLGADLEEEFLKRMKTAISNIPEHGDGRAIYEKWIKPAILDLHRVGAHYAVNSLFEEYPDEADIYCYDVRQGDYRLSVAGLSKMAVGRARVTSRITREYADLVFAVLHLGDHTIHCGVGPYKSKQEYRRATEGAEKAFHNADFPAAILEINRNFMGSIYSLKNLFRDQQQRVSHQILEGSVLGEAEASYRRLYENHAPLMRFLSDSRMPQPKVLYIAAEFVLNNTLGRRLGEEELNYEAIETFLEEARKLGVNLDATTLEFELRHNLEGITRELQRNPTDTTLLELLLNGAEIVRLVPFNVNLFSVENIGWELTRDVYPELLTKALHGDEQAARVAELYRDLVEKLFHFQRLGE